MCKSGRIGALLSGGVSWTSVPIVVSFASLISDMVPTRAQTTNIEQKGLRGVSLLKAWLVSPTARYTLKTYTPNRLSLATKAYNSLRGQIRTCLRMSGGRMSQRKQYWRLLLDLILVAVLPLASWLLPEGALRNARQAKMAGVARRTTAGR